MVNGGYPDVAALLRSSLEGMQLTAAVRAVEAVVDDYWRAAVGSRHLPGTGSAAVRRAVHGGVPAAVLQRSLWQAHLLLLDRRLTAAGGQVRTEDLTSFTIRYCDQVSKAYAGPDQRDVLVRLLADGTPDVAEAGRVLRLRLADHHWAAVLSPVPDSGVVVEDLVRFALTVARTVGGARPLVAVNHADEVWMWTRWPSPPCPETFAAACARLRVPDGLRIGAGPIAPGAAGFRRSLLGARAACQAAVHDQDCRWCDYQDASPVSLLTGDEEQARWFVDEVLGELGSDEPWHATLRETLRLYLARGRSRQQVAAAMYINRNTVAYRVQKAAQLLGRPIDEDAFDVRLALEIARTTGARSV
jgi:hypothetical protein